jgi:NADH-quinone oxidoreductase subunit L
VQVDIKRVIAYSTMSQIGYMFLAAGLGAYANAMFHLMTHAFFKALLFLAAGIVIHALAGEQDMRKMGGLRRVLPKTWLAFLIGALALSGIPPLSGFFSKDSILASALAEGASGRVLLVVGLIGAFLTGLYTFRMVFIVFGGELSAYAREHLHRPDRSEPWLWMGSTVAVLAVLTVVGGWLQIAGVWHPFADFLEPAVEPLFEPSGTQDVVASVLAVTLGLAGIALAWWLYSARARPVPHIRPLQTLLERKFYFDEAYDWAFYRPAVLLAVGLRKLIEEPLIAGSLTGVAFGARRAGGEVAETQTGLVRTYAILLAASVAALGLVFVWVR